MPATRKLNRRETVLLAVLVVVMLALGWWWLRPSTREAAPLARIDQVSGNVPRIGLDRLDKRGSNAEAGRRNLFAFGTRRVEPTPTPEVTSATPPPPPPPVDTPTTAAASLPPLNVKYIGSVENATGAKVAVLVTDRQEVLTGQSGQVIANRYRVARIGLESVDLEDITTGQSRRIALRGN